MKTHRSSMSKRFGRLGGRLGGSLGGARLLRFGAAAIAIPFPAVWGARAARGEAARKNASVYSLSQNGLSQNGYGKKNIL